MNRVTRGLVVTLAMMSAACAEGGPDPSAGVTSVDSAGVEIVSVSTPPEAFGPVALLDSEPDLVLGALEGDRPDLFGSIADVHQMPDGSVLVADGQAMEILHFERDGTYRGRLGGEGDGPGEFQDIGSILSGGAEGIVLWDARAQRITRFTAGGEAVESIRVEAATRIMSLQEFHDGTLLAASRWSPFGFAPPPTDGIELQRDSTVLARHDAEGVLMDTLAILPAGERFRSIEVGDGFVQSSERSVPVSHTAAYAVVRDGFVAASNDRFEFRWWTPEGTVTRITRIPSFDRPLSDGDIDELREARIARSTDPAARLAVQEDFDRFDFPPLRPAFQAILPSTDGGVWVREHRLWQHESPRWWLLDGESGRPTGYLEVPPELDLREIGKEYLLAIRWDDLGVPYLHRYRIRAPPAT